jgi:selenocysteine-specific elongation factor
VIVGTAGHIDHGKSALVTALTGRTVDRLAEEQRRGITIDLNFAPLLLPGMGPVGIVDVPGHEDFVRTMVAGASGIDVVLLVVDGQEGIRPQTLEHLTVVEQLGIPRGIAVVTKADLVEEEWLELVRAEVSERLRQSPVVFDSPLITSATTGRGLEALRESIVRHASQTVPRSPEDLFRLPVDRVFAVAGIGTVVTGTVWSGAIRLGDPIEVQPQGLNGRVRTLECYGESVGEVGPGVRTAIGITGVSRGDVARGSIVLTPEAGWRSTTILDAMLDLGSQAPKSLKPRDRVRLHHGTAEVMARVYPRGEIRPGTMGPARVVLETPLALRGMDRLVLRRYSPVVTIGGGWVIDPAPPRRASWSSGLEQLDAAARLAALVVRRVHGMPQLELPIAIGLPAGTASRIALEAPGITSIAGTWIGEDRVVAVRDHLLAKIAEFHKREASSPGISVETLRSGLGGRAWLADAVLSDLTASGKVVIRKGVVSLHTFQAQAGGGEEEVDSLVATLAKAGLEAPNLGELAKTGFVDLQGAVRIASSRGLITAVERDRYYDTRVLEHFLSVVREVGSSRDGEIVPADLREKTGLSRRVLIPLLEWSDRQGVTRRGPTGTRRLTQ